MSSLFKDIYSESFYDQFSTILKHSISQFDKTKFNDLIFCEEFESYELKERMTHTAKTLNYFLSDDFEIATQSIKHIISDLRTARIEEDSVEFMFFPEYISLYGMNDYQTSIAAFEFITQFTSCEFAVRPFLIQYEKAMLKQMAVWSKHPNHRVRRLASEGSRPRLPWAMALPSFKHDPEPLLTILRNLKQDDSEIVRRSVANNLNDISKDNPHIVIDITTEWLGHSRQTDALLKHGCRTLLKQGNAIILDLFGFDAHNIEPYDFQIDTAVVKMGKNLAFSFSVRNNANADKMVRIEYGLYYQKKNGSLARKVFKISEREIKSASHIDINRKQSFKLISTRKFHTGTHRLSIIINGQESEKKEFMLES